MPQISVEYTSNVAGLADYRQIGLALNRLAVDVVAARLEDCKTRLVEVGHYVIGDGLGDDAFIHVTLALLAGRPDAAKEGLAAQALELVMAALPPASAPESLQISVEVRDMDRASYRKQILVKSQG